MPAWGQGCRGVEGLLRRLGGRTGIGRERERLLGHGPSLLDTDPRIGGGLPHSRRKRNEVHFQHKESRLGDKSGYNWGLATERWTSDLLTREAGPRGPWILTDHSIHLVKSWTRICFSVLGIRSRTL